MKVVIDTNVWVSGVFWSGVPGAIVDAWTEGRYDLVVSVDTLSELHRVLRDIAAKTGFEDIEHTLHLIDSNAAIVEPAEVDPSLCRDPDDVKFLAASKAGRANYLVTGDGDLLDLESFEGTEIVSPRAFKSKVLD